MARFLFATMPITGHVAPGLPIARALVARGHEVCWYGGSRFRARIEATGARYLPMQAAYDYDDLDLNGAFPGRAALGDFAQFKFDMKYLFASAAAGQVRDLEDILDAFPADVLICDTGFFGASLLHERRGLPWAGYGVTALTFASRDTAPFGLGLLPDSSPLGQVRNRALYWLLDRILFRDVNAHWNKVRADVGLPPATKRFLDAPLSPFLYLQPTVPAFEYPRRDLAPQVHFVGPLLPDPPAEFTPPSWWADLASARQAGRPVVHVTQGTSATEASQLIIPTTRALAEEDVLVVATTGGKPAASLDLDPVPANARVEQFIPYYHLLPHVTAMVTNAGYGGVQIALSHGIPLVAAGSTEDKPEIANRVAWAGAGINLKTKTPTASQIRAAVHKILAEPEYRRKAEELQGEYRRYDAPPLAATLLEQLAATKKPNISHYNETAEQHGVPVPA